MVSFREYAEKNGISYETVRKQVQRYSEELSGHVETNGNTRYLDDAAVAFLNGKRSVNKVQVIAGDPEQERELIEVKKQKAELQTKVEEMSTELLARSKEVEGLKDKLIQQQETIISLQQQIIEMQHKQIKPETAGDPEEQPEEKTAGGDPTAAPEESTAADPEQKQTADEDLRTEERPEEVGFWKRIFSFWKH